MKKGTQTIEFELREIDANGEAFRIDHFASAEEAIRAAQTVIGGETVAYVIEKHVSRRPAYLFGEPDKFTTLAVGGCTDALRNGDWIA